MRVNRMALTAEDAECQKKRCPKPVLPLHERCGHTGERTDFDTSIVNGVYAVVGDPGIYNDTLPRLWVLSYYHLLLMVLISNHRGHIGFDAASAKANGDERNYESRQSA